MAMSEADKQVVEEQIREICQSTRRALAARVAVVAVLYPDPDGTSFHDVATFGYDDHREEDYANLPNGDFVATAHVAAVWLSMAQESIHDLLPGTKLMVQAEDGDMFSVQEMLQGYPEATDADHG